MSKIFQILDKKLYFYSDIHKNCRHLGFFPIKDMQILPPPLRSGGNFMKVGECAEYNGKYNKKNSPIFIF